MKLIAFALPFGRSRQLLLALLLSALPAAVQADDYIYTTGNGIATITRYIGPGGAVTIPSNLGGCSIIAIGDDAFLLCTNLSSLTVSDSVISIGSSAFQWCTNLSNVTIGAYVTTIGANAFEGCNSLTNLTMGKIVSYIGNHVFDGCTSLTAITVDALNTNYSSLDGVLFNKGQTTLIQFPGAKGGSYTIPNSVICLGDGAFYECASLSGVTVPNSVTSIGNYAFRGTGLTTITIPNSVTSIGWSAFYWCKSLTNVTIGNGVGKIGGLFFAHCTSLNEVCFLGNAPSLGSDVFYNANNPTVYYLPGTVGWDATFAGRPTAFLYLLQPIILALPPYFGVRTNQFGFRVSWATNASVVLDACTNLAAPT
jgi:hypothetical protein